MTSVAHTLTEGLITLSQSLTDLGHTHAKKGRPSVNFDFITGLLTYLFLDNQSFQDDPEWGESQILKLSALLADAYMEGYAQAQKESL